MFFLIIYSCALYAQEEYYEPSENTGIPTPSEKTRLALEFHADGGHNQTYSGFAQISPNIQYAAGERSILRAGANCLFASDAIPFFNAFGFAFDYKMLDKEQKKLFIRPGFLYRYPSKNIRDNNYFLLLEFYKNDWKFNFGNTVRVIGFSKSVRTNNNFPKENSRLTDYRNFMYYLGYSLKPENKNWRLNVAIANFDRFLIELETNPMLQLSGEYKLGNNTKLFAQAIYRTAGSLNLAANHFGYLFRGGVQWYIL